MDKANFRQVAIAATAFFLVGFWIHYPNVLPSYYSDLIALWQEKAFSGGIPYVNYELEYPALSGILIYVSSVWRNVLLYYDILGLVTYLCMILSLYLVYKMLCASNQSINKINYFIIFTPTFLFFSTYSFDWLGVSLLLLSIWFAYNKKRSYSGLFMGLSVAARIIPIICLPFILREFSAWRDRVIILYAAASTWLICNIFFIIANFKGFLYPYVFQATYSAEDSWLQLIPYNTNIISLLLFALCMILVWYRRNQFSLLEISFLALLGFVLTSFKFPPQYMILLLPFFALNKTDYFLFMVADVLNVMIILWMYAYLGFNFGPKVQWVAIIRQVVLLPVFANLFRSSYKK